MFVAYIIVLSFAALLYLLSIPGLIKLIREAEYSKFVLALLPLVFLGFAHVYFYG